MKETHDKTPNKPERKIERKQEILTKTKQHKNKAQ
jgi:hypothetical protein